MHSKKGLSEVMTTVLLILVAIAAVTLIWYALQPNIKSASTSASKAQVCLSSVVEPISCKKNASGSYNVGYRRATDDNIVQGIESVQITLEQKDGIVKTISGDSGISNGDSSNVAFTNVSGGARQVTINAQFILKGDQKQLCRSSELLCDNI